MTTYTLASPREKTTVVQLARLFEQTTAHRLALAVHEDNACQSWIQLGEVTLRPGVTEAKREEPDPFETAIRLGSFEWAYPDHDEVLASARAATAREAPSGNKKGGGDDPMRRVLDHIPFVAARVGLLLPYLDAKIASTLPFRRPVTLVMDTSAILQGGLHFAVRFLCPAARIRVPAVVHMELLSQTDNYLRLRREGGSKARAMLERATGVGGQRALIRVELSDDVEIERATVGADPLRGIVRLDEEDKNLHLEHVQRSFADRLIFETAREHQSRCAPGHRVILMTSDEGLSRMTIGEGMTSFLVRAPKPEAISNAVLTGTCFHPFKPEMYAVPLPALLWELAVTFGAVRLSSSDTAFEVRAIGKDLPWLPYHTIEDLLWVRLAPPDANDSSAPVVKSGQTAATGKRGALENRSPVAAPARSQGRSGKDQEAVDSVEPKERSGSYKFSIKRMMQLVNALAERRTLSSSEVTAVLAVNESATPDYKNFLVSGSFVEATTEGLKATAALDDLWNALGAANHAAVEALFRCVPTVRDFFEYVKTHRKASKSDKLPVPARAFTTYLALAEVAAVALSIYEESLFATDAVPSVAEFAVLAWKTYSALTQGDEFIATGAWLEALARDHAIHPVRSRALLEEAWRAGLLDRFVEGSTPDTRYENHTFWALAGRQGAPDVQQVKLYHGDFLMPERASVSLRLVKKDMQ